MVLLLATANICLSAETTTLYSNSMKTLESRYASADPNRWSFVFVGDNRGNDRKFVEILQRAKDINPLFILHGGDISERGNSQELSHFLDVVKSIKDLPPLFVVRGNHESNPSLFEKMIGPFNFAIDNQKLGLRLVSVDNSNYLLKKEELSFLSTNLDNKRQHQFVSMHIPPKTERWPRHSFEMGSNELFQLMTDRKVEMGLFAHIHLFDADMINNIPYIISGGAGASLTWFGYSGDADYHLVIIEVVKGKVTYRVEKLD
jgi:Icc-related predicted phosphoesterase